MSVITEAIVGRMAGDAQLAGLLSVFAGRPSVFSTDPVPPQARRPYVHCATVVRDEDMGTKTDELREHDRDLVCVDDATGDGMRIEAIAERVRALFNRQPLAIDGYTNFIVKASGPTLAPADPSLYARRVGLRLTLSSLGGGVAVVPVGLIAWLGGSDTEFANPAVINAYPSGSGFDALVGQTVPFVQDPAYLATGTYVLACAAKVDGSGGRAKVALVDLAAPSTPLVEILFPSGDQVGTLLQSAAIPWPPGGTTRSFGLKVTTNNTGVGAAVWGAQIQRLN